MDGLRSEGQEPIPEELPTYARVEDFKRYTIGGFHPIQIGDRIGPEERFEIHHKLGYSDACTVWLCLDRKNRRRVGVKVFQADKSIESHPEIAALRLFEGADRRELQSNHIFTINEYFWVEGPNGRHLCFVVQVLGPAISYSLRGIDLDTPDLLTDLCYQAAKSLKYLHDKKICHGDFRPDHMRMQLDTGKMSDADFDIYEIFGEPKVWYVNDSQSENDDGRPRYLVEPADLAGLEARYRTGRIAIDSFSASYREGDVSEPQMLDTHYAAPEIHFLKKSCGASSDIWSLASTIHLIRTSKSLLARLDSRSSLVSWLAWAYGPFPQDAWKAVGEYLSSDSAIPVFTVNTIPQKPPVSSSGHLAKLMGVKVDPYPSEWGENREKVVALMLGDEETPLSIRQRKMLQGEKDRGKYLRIKLPKDSRVWAKFQDQRKRATGCHSLLHEDLSKKRQWYQDTDALNGKTEHRPEISPSMIDDSTLRRLNGKWTLTSNSELDAEGVSGDHAVIDIPNKNGKRALVGDHYGQLNPKKARKFIAEHNLRDQVERVEQNDGMTRFSYCLQPREVDLLASLLRDMLRNDPGERVSIDKVLQHKWFDASRRRLE